MGLVGPITEKRFLVLIRVSSCSS